MDVVVAGGHGKVGLRLLRLLADRGHRARGLIRNPDHGPDLYAAGAGPGSGSERKRTVDYGGAVKLIDAAKKGGIDRYVMVSAMKVDRPDEWSDEMRPYYEAKRDADEALVRSGPVYTIVRPGWLTDDVGTGLVELGFGLEDGQIPRDDVAATLFFTLDAINTYAQAFDVVSGDDPVEDAVRAL